MIPWHPRLIQIAHPVCLRRCDTCDKPQFHNSQWLEVQSSRGWQYFSFCCFFALLNFKVQRHHGNSSWDECLGSSILASQGCGVSLWHTVANDTFVVAFCGGFLESQLWTLDPGDQQVQQGCVFGITWFRTTNLGWESGEAWKRSDDPHWYYQWLC